MDVSVGALVTIIYRVLGTFFIALIGIITARALSLEDRGVFVTVTLVIGGIASVTAAFSTATGYYVSNQKKDAAEVAANGTILSLGMGAVLLVGGVVLWALGIGEHPYFALFVGLALLPLIARSTLGTVFLGTGEVGKSSFALQSAYVFTVILMLIWLPLGSGRTAEVALALWIGGQYFALFATVLLRPAWWGWMLSHRPNPGLMRNFLTFGTITGLAGFVGYFNYRVDQLLVVWIDGSAANAIYASAVAIAEGMWLFSTAISVASFSRIGSLSREASAELTAQAVRHTILVVSFGAVALAILAPFLLGALYGDRFVEAAHALRILAIGTAIWAPATILSQYFSIQLGRPVVPLIFSTFSCLTNIALSVILISRFGYIGGAYATTISYGLTNAALAWTFVRYSSASWSDLLRLGRRDIDTYINLGRRVLRGELLHQLGPRTGTRG